jgi:hypothetical protein
VFEHSYFDVVVGATRHSSAAGPRLARALWRLLPKPDLVFLLDSETDTLAHRHIPARQLPAGHVFDRNSPMTVVADDIQRIIRAWISERSVATLGAQAALVATPTLNAVDSIGASTSVSRGDRVS